MCVIMVKELNKENFSNNDLENGMQTNSDGFSITVFDKNYIEVEMLKTLKKQDIYNFTKKYDGHEKEYLFIYHFRIATNGIKCKNNCHPFENKNYIIWHNGIINEFSSSIDKVDTKCFLDKYFYRQLKENKIKSILEKMEKENNKIIIYNKYKHEFYSTKNFQNYKDNIVSNTFFTFQNAYNIYDDEDYYMNYEKYLNKDYNEFDFDYLCEKIEKLENKIALLEDKIDLLIQ